MDDNVLRFRVGVVVVVAAIVSVVLIMLFGAWPTMLQPHYILHIQFPEAPGITINTPVRKSGVLIGRVSDVELLDEGGVLVTARINQQYRLRRNETCRIGSGSLLGDAVLEFVPSTKQELLARFDVNQNGRFDAEEKQLATEVLSDGDFLSDGIVASNPLRVLVNLEGTIASAFTSIETAGEEVASLARSLNGAFDASDGQIIRILDKTETALDGLQRTMQTVDRTLGDEELSERLLRMLNELPEFVAESRETMATARTTLDSFTRMGEKAEANLDNLEQLTRPLGERGDQLVRNIETSTENLNLMLTQFVAFSEALNRGQGTLGRLVYDDEVYHRLERLVTNAEDLSRRLRPIVDDVRVFTDKIARDPSQLGVRGALDRRPPGVKTGVTLW